MNNLYHWHDEAMVGLKMEETRREMESIRLLQDAGLTNPGLWERAAIVVGGTLIKLGKRLHKAYTDPNRAYQVTSSKFAA